MGIAEGSANNINKSKLFNIQYLRAIAAIFVLLFHTTNLIQQQIHYEYSYNIFRFGYMGVDLFFVISGFIISYNHKADFGVKSKLRAYFSKRLLRIYPVYWVLMLPAVIFHFLIPSFGDEYKRHFTEILQSMLLIPQDHHPILDVAWTLRHEIFFYIIFGFLFIYNRSPIIFSTCILLWAGMSTYSLLFNPNDPWLLFGYLFSPYNLEFLLGCLVAYVITKYKINLKLARISILIGIVLFLLSCSNEFLAYSGVNRIIKWGIPSALLIYGAVVFDVKAKIRPNRILNFIGDASYSIYLTHVPAIYFFIMIFYKLNLFNVFGYFAAATICIVLILIGGCIFYQIIEKPVLKLARRIFIKNKLRHGNTDQILYLKNT